MNINSSLPDNFDDSQTISGSPIRLINNHMYCVDSETYKGDINRPWVKKYIYKYSDENGNIVFGKTSNICRHNLNDDSYHLGDIGIKKIKHYVGLDKEKDNIIYNLLYNKLLPVLSFQPNKAIEVGLNMISPDLCKDYFTRKSVSEYKKLYGADNIRLLVWDTETTGLGENDRIVQIAVYDVFNDTVFNKKINPFPQKMSKIAERITGISNESLINEPVFGDVVYELEDFINNKDSNKITIMIAHNSDFDEKMIRREYRNINRSLLPNIVFADSLEMCKVWISSNKYELDTKSKKPLKGIFKLSTNENDNEEIQGKDLYNRYFMENMPSGHDACGDVIGLYKVLCAMFLECWNNNEYWFMNKKILELTYISEILDTPYINDLMDSY
jgi:DNA polymerase III epsilon subunit-like protein